MAKKEKTERRPRRAAPGSIDRPAARAGYQQAVSAGLVLFKELGEKLEGVFISRKPQSGRYKSDILSFKDRKGVVWSCYSSKCIDDGFSAEGIEPDGTFEVCLTLIGILPLTGGRQFKQFDIQFRKVKK